MKLGRIRKGVRRGPRVGHRTTPVSFFAMGVAAAETHEAAHLDDIVALGSRTGATWPSVWLSRKPPLPEVTPGMSRERSSSVWGGRPAALARLGRVAAERPRSNAGRHGSCVDEPLVPLHRRTPNENAHNRNDEVVSIRPAPVRHQGQPAPWRTDRQRGHVVRCYDGHLRLLLPQRGQHLPFPLRNARVEVGRLVMEG